MATVPNSVFAEFYAEQIKDQLFASNRFLDFLTNESSYLNGRVVHIPNYTNDPKIFIDGEEGGSDYAYGFDTVATQETDLTFTIQSYRLEPIRVEDFDELVTNYDKMAAVTRNSINKLNKVVGDNMLKNIGASVIAGNKLTLASGATMTYNDVVAMAQKLDEQDVSSEGRYLLLTPDMYYSLIKDDAVRIASDFGQATLPTGVVSQIAGINLLAPRSQVVLTDGSGNVSLTGGTNAGLCWVSDSIAGAWDDAKVYENQGVAQLYGNVISAEVPMGCKVSRTDGKGVILIENV